jgi:histidinol-phosphate aminotransferase
VNAVAEKVALAALGDGSGFVDRSVAAAVEARERLAVELARRGLRALPSLANFLLVPVPSAEALAARLQARGVRVRALPALAGVGDALRIGVAPWNRLERLLAAIDEEVPPCA